MGTSIKVMGKRYGAPCRGDDTGRPTESSSEGRGWPAPGWKFHVWRSYTCHVAYNDPLTWAAGGQIQPSVAVGCHAGAGWDSETLADLCGSPVCSLCPGCLVFLLDEHFSLMPFFPTERISHAWVLLHGRAHLHK